MKIRRLVLGRTINTGNYESVRCDVDIELSDGDPIDDARQWLEEQVNDWEFSLKQKYATGKK